MKCSEESRCRRSSSCSFPYRKFLFGPLKAPEHVEALGPLLSIVVCQHSSVIVGVNRCYRHFALGYRRCLRAAKEQLIAKGRTEAAFETIGNISGLIFHHDPLSDYWYVYALARCEGCMNKLFEHFGSFRD